MNVLLLDPMETFLDFALRCERAGHYVRLCVGRDPKTHKRRTAGDGLVQKIENEEWQKHVGWADLIVTSDNTRWLRELDAYRRRGYPVFGPSPEAADLELVRSKGQALLKKNGIKVIDYESFSDFGQAEKYVREQGRTFVAKPDGDKDKALSYVAKSPKDMTFMLRRWKEMNANPGRFMLQEFVPGVEFAVAGWLGSKGFASHFEENFEHKKLMNEDYGPNTGEMGTCCKYVEDSALAKEVLLPLERDLMRMGCTGSVDVSVIVDESGTPRPLEFTCRLGWPSFYIVQGLHPEPCEWMADLIDGKDSFRPTDQHATGVVVTMPPFPYPDDHDEKKVTGIPIWGLDPDNEYFEQIAPASLKAGMAPNDELEDERCFVSCGDYLLVANGYADTVRKANKEAYKVVKSLHIPNDPIVRTDIGEIERDLETLQGYGFAKDWVY